jgi:1-acyl-sn-glycerol-3-phosphate acyltransferase
MSNDGASSMRRRVRRAVGHAWLSAFGWTAVGQPLPPKAMIVAAPHTTSWDLPFTLAVCYVLDFEFSWLGKHTLFKPPYGWFFRWLGGIPVDRRDRNNAVASVIERIKQHDEIKIILAPEGTRSSAKRWKTGFYYMALGADVPIALAFLDYRNKRGGILHVFHPTGDIDADMAMIQKYYVNIEGKYTNRMSKLTPQELLHSSRSRESIARRLGDVA